MQANDGCVFTGDETQAAGARFVRQMVQPDRFRGTSIVKELVPPIQAERNIGVRKFLCVAETFVIVGAPNVEKQQERAYGYVIDIRQHETP